ncbi:ATP-binding protein [Streptomyces sp. NBC_01255]|uniref:ATP-binding protein n=1 Tax=Streptomyces sp. NBC_01255 TaxID=2903798 RepID=UPI002E3427E7|nr:ATP-binding protein [Streptomyces sp. NBC_01255]
MIIDPAQPWGVAIDYAGRATVTDGGHTVDVRIHDTTMGGPLEVDPMTGEYPQVYVTAQLDEAGTAGSSLRGSGLVILNAQGGLPVVPNQEAVRDAVAAALADFETRRTAYATLCTTWAPPAPDPTPTPEPEPTPTPEPEPIPEQPSKEPTPEPASEPVPDPAPEAAPEPSKDPEPTPTA